MLAASSTSAISRAQDTHNDSGMRVLTFLNGLGMGGTEMAAARWALALSQRGHDVSVVALDDGPRRNQFEHAGIEVWLTGRSESLLVDALLRLRPDVIHAHVPGYKHDGDLLGGALARVGGSRPRVVQTNVFGRLQNPAEAAWTDFRLFVSWTSCVQAARRARLPLDEHFFLHASVAANPLDAKEPSAPTQVRDFRERLGVKPDDVLCGRLSRPDPGKWTTLAVEAFDLASRTHPKLKFLLREPPPAVADELRRGSRADRYVILPATSNPEELLLTMSALDMVIHTSSMGESFGYGLAEPMNIGKPVITHSVPTGDQAQLELVQDGRCGYVASLPATMAQRILTLAADACLREAFGRAAQAHIRTIADVEQSVSRLEDTFSAVIDRRANPRRGADLARAREIERNLDRYQFGRGWREQVALRRLQWKAR
jgi:glycosyltransferase involved in cell wall biosynthesis